MAHIFTTVQLAVANQYNAFDAGKVATLSPARAEAHSSQRKHQLTLWLKISKQPQARRDRTDKSGYPS